MLASEFEYRHRFLMMLFVYLLAYATYNLDHLNVLYSIVPWNQGVSPRDTLVRFLYATAALVAGGGAALLTWATAYRPTSVTKDRTPFSVSGPFRHVRNPQYLAYFLLLLALGSFQSRLGFPVMLLGEIIVLWRLVAREELRLSREHGKHFRAYAQRVPRLLPSLRPRVPEDEQLPNWTQALWDQAFQWGFVATLLAFAFTLRDPVGYAFAYATLGFLLIQKLTSALRFRFRHTSS